LFHYNSIYWIILLVSDKYESEEPEEMKVDNDCELIWAKLKIKGSKDLYIASCYRPPDNRNIIYLENLQTYLANILAHEGAHIWLGGYFNLSGIDWQNVNIKHNSQHTAEFHELLDISKHAFLDDPVLQPTQITETQSNTLDLSFTNNNTLVNQVRVIPGISDHEAAAIESSLRPIKKLGITREV
jgi:hypothetical protein